MLSSHSIAIQQLVAIGRAMVLDAKVLILDEPTSSLDRGEVEQLFAVIRDLRARGVAILFVSHFLDQVYEISDRITVLRNGQLVGEYLVGDLPRGELVTKMIGRELDELAALASVADRAIDRTGTPVLRATGIGRRGVLEPADIDVFEGEVVGIAGLLGSGRTELVRLLYGADRAETRADRGERQGREARLAAAGDREPHRLLVRGPPRRRHHRRPDRRREHRARHPGTTRRDAQDRRGRSRRRRAGVHERARRPARRPHMLAGNLSGGNQQKVLLARWLATAPELIVLDEPTRGIDVGAKADIQRKVAELSANGLSVVFISSELEEVLRLAQRVIVMRDRRKIGELDSSGADVDGLIDYIANEGQESAA